VLIGLPARVRAISDELCPGCASTHTSGIAGSQTMLGAWINPFTGDFRRGAARRRRD
jgi:hypothetical protein